MGTFPEDQKSTRGEWIVDPALARLAEALPKPMALLTPQGQVVYLNRAARLLTRQTISSPEGFPLEQWQPGWACALLREEAMPMALREGSWRGEAALTLPGQAELPIEESLLSVGTVDEPLLVAVLHDLTARKASALERIELTNGFDAAIRGSRQVYFRWQVESGTLTLQGDLHSLFRYPVGEVPATLEELRSLVHLDDLPRFDAEWQRSAATHSPLDLDFRLQRPSGEFVIVQVRGAFFLDRHGQLAQLAGFLWDGTAQRLVQEQLAQAKTKLEQRLQSRLQEARDEAADAQRVLSELLSRISHELRTPLNAILGFTQLLELESNSPRQKESLEHISKAGRHLLTLINEVLHHPGTTGAMPPATRPTTAEAPSGDPRYRLLYVEDEVLNVELMKRVVSTYPQYELLCTSHGQEAVPLAHDYQPHLILLDLNLPDISGEAVLGQLKSDPEVRDIPVIMVTADAATASVERLLAKGALTYLTKPFRISEFLTVLREALETDSTEDA